MWSYKFAPVWIESIILVHDDSKEGLSHQMTLFECFREDPRSESTQSRDVCDDTHSTSDEQPDFEQFEDQFLNSSLSPGVSEELPSTSQQSDETVQSAQTDPPFSLVQINFC